MNEKDNVVSCSLLVFNLSFLSQCVNIIFIIYTIYNFLLHFLHFSVFGYNSDVDLQSSAKVI